MLISKYIKSYLDYYQELNLPGIGTIFMKKTPVTIEDNLLIPSYKKYSVQQEISDHIEHFVLFVLYYEKGNFEDLKNHILSDLRYWKSQLSEEDATIFIEEIGSLRYFKNEITLFPEKQLEKESFGYPKIEK